MTAFEVFDALEQTWIGQSIRESLWLFPAIEAVHLLGLAILGGSVLVVDLRLLGTGLVRASVPAVLASARPWFAGALVLMFCTGIPLFLSEAIKCYYNTSFWVKMSTLPFALGFTFGVKGRMAADRTLETSARSRLLGVLSIVLWFTVAAAGRWIGLS